MRKLVKLEKDNDIIYSSRIEEYLNPDYVYIPVKDGYSIIVRQNEKVYKGQIIAENNLNKILSSVSGVVLKVQPMMVDNSITNTIVIQNNFKEEEKSVKKNYPNKLNKEVLINTLYDFHFKYIASLIENKKITNLVINTLTDEPYILNNQYLLSDKVKEVLEMIDILSNNLNIPNSYLAIKSNDTKNIEKYLGKIGMYPNIKVKLIEDKYLLGKDFFLIENMELSYEETLIIDIRTLCEMYNAIKYHKNTYTTYITIAGCSLDKSKVIKVKIGTLLRDVIASKIKIKGSDNIFVLDGLLTGHKCDINTSIVTKNTLGVIVIKDENIKEEKCINCGLCTKICPVRVNPRKIMETNKVSKNCLNCGLCSYICPSHINIRKYLEGKNE